MTDHGSAPDSFVPGPPTSKWPTLRYGALERLLMALVGADAHTVTARFRKLRLRPFPDAIRSGTGNKVQYDLPRTAAIALVFVINGLRVPQGQAVDLVSANWPECVRGLLAAAAEAGLISRPAGMPAEAGPVLIIVPGGLDNGEEARGNAAARSYALHVKREGLSPADWGAAMVVDCRIIIDAIIAEGDLADDKANMVQAFEDLDRTFGWRYGPTPLRIPVASMGAGASFLDEGPYFGRVRALFELVQSADPEIRSKWATAHAERLLCYLEHPAPIDAWKPEVGTDASRPRLRHIIDAWASLFGLTTPVTYPETLRGAVGEDPKMQAMMLVELAERIGSRVAAE